MELNGTWAPALECIVFKLCIKASIAWYVSLSVSLYALEVAKSIISSTNWLILFLINISFNFWLKFSLKSRVGFKHIFSLILDTTSSPSSFVSKVIALLRL